MIFVSKINTINSIIQLVIRQLTIFIKLNLYKGHGYQTEQYILELKET